MEKTKKIAIYGAGGFGRELACMINMINDAEGKKWEIIGFFDDGKIKGSKNEYGEVLGNLETLNNWPEPISVALAIGSPKYLKSLSEGILNPLVSFPNIIAPGSLFYDENNLKIGKGNIICPLSIISCNVTIGDFNLFNGRISIGHDVSIKSFNAFMPGVKISGEVSIGNSNLFGADSFIKQQISVGENIVLSPLSALLTKPKDNHLYIGNPAKIFKF